jgi:hypothetical protein
MAIKYSSIGGGLGTGFNVQIGSQYSYATFTQAQPAGAYTIKSSNNYTNWDVYLLDASNNLVAYTGSASIAPTTAFSAIMVVNGTLNDILQFSFASTVFSTATTSQTKAGPFITTFGSSVIPSVNSAVTITGGNFAVGITATFTGTDSVVRTCKSVVYTSTSSISVVRPDVLPIAYAPYVLTLTNPGINNPVTSGKNILTGLTVGNAPVWVTGTSLPAASNGTVYSTTLVATDVEGAVTYSYVSGSLPAGLSFNASTGVISGTYSAYTDGSVSYTVRATDSGGNFTDRTFTIAYTGLGGGTLTSDATYYYRVFTSNGSLTGASGLLVDILSIAGGGAGAARIGGGGGAGGVVYFAGQTVNVNNTITVGGGGTGIITSVDISSPSGQGSSGNPSQFGSLQAAYGGGGGGWTDGGVGSNGGSGGGGGRYGANPGNAGGSATQIGSGATAFHGNAGGRGTIATATPDRSGGGGGAGAAGADGSSTGVGGIGTNSYSAILTAISSAMSGVSGWSAATSGVYIAAGGGGGGYPSLGSATGGAGGGGAGGTGNTSPAPGVSAIQSTGSGGGGGGYPGSAESSGSGGSGLVVVRYTRASVGG